MSNLRLMPLSDVVRFKKGINYTSNDYGNEDNGIPFITIKCLKKGGGYEKTGLKYFKGIFNESDTLVKEEVLFSVTDLTRAGDIVGSPLRVPDFGRNKMSLASMDLMKVEPKNDQCIGEYIYYCLMSDNIHRKMVAYSAGSTVLHLDIKRVPEFTIPIPKIAFQRKIARILSCVDEVIEKTEVAIEKYKAIKQGMMHDLFTRGIDLATGKLRSSYEDAPELYKKSELGWVPKEWDVVRLVDLSKDGLKNGYFKKPEYVGWGYKLINVTDLYQPFEIDINQNDVQRVFATASDYTKYEVQVGDIFFTRSSLVLEGIAHCNIVLNLSEKAVWECHVVRLRPDKQKINPQFLGFYCMTYAARLFFMSIAKQVTMTTISQPDIAKLPVPFPKNIDEQNEIAKRLRAIDANIRNEEGIHFKYMNLKQALMSDLLTGRVRVKV